MNTLLSDAKIADIDDGRLGQNGSILDVDTLIATLDRARVLVMTLTPEGCITKTNTACEKCLGYAEHELLHRELWGLMYDPGEIALVKDAFALLPDGDFPQGFVDHFRAKDGSDRLISWSSNVAKDEDGASPHVILVGRDLTPSKEAEKTDAWFRLLLEQLPAIVWSVDKNLQITSSMGSGLAGLGLHPHQLEGVSLYQYLHTNDPSQRDAQYILRALRGEFVQYEAQRFGRIFQTAMQPLRDDSGDISGAVSLVVDITDRKRMEDALSRSRDELHQFAEKEKHARLEAERLSRIKDEFLVTLSHELRTPLVPILGWLELIHSEDLDQVQLADILKTIERNAKTELQLIEELLDASRMITGKLRLNIAPLNLSDPVHDAIAIMRHAAETKHIDLRVRADKGPFNLKGDEKRLQQVVWNLLSNAIKFTGSGGRIDVDLSRQDNMLILAVKDNGIGIRADFLPHVFERFSQADSSISRNMGGLGLGLSLVQYIVLAHGGSAEAKSDGEGKGATFTVRLPGAQRSRDD